MEEAERLCDRVAIMENGRIIDIDTPANLVLDQFAFSGTPDQVAAQVEALLEAGVTRVEFGTPHGLTAASGIELLGRRVLPAVRGG